MQSDIIREPVELIDEDLDAVAGGKGLNINVDVNIASITQLLQQVQTTVFGSNTATAAQVADISQTA